MILIWLGCTAQDKSVLSTEPMSVEAWVDDKQIDSEGSIDLHVEIRYAPEYSPTILPPRAEGLNIELVDKTDVIWIGAQQQQVFNYALSGKDGSYIVQPAVVSSDALEQDLEANLIYVDIGTVPESAQLAEAVPPPKSDGELMWAWGLIGAAALIVGGIMYSRRRVQPISPKLVAKQNWTKAKELEPHPRAVQASMIIREYLRDVHQAPLIELSAEESLRWLKVSHLPPKMQAHIQQVLTATDRLKFARQGGGEGFFRDLDIAFECILDVEVEEE